MRCLSCEKLSYLIICKKCQNSFLKPILNKRELSKDFFVYSFFKFEEIKELLNSKYYFYGDRVYNILSNLTFKQYSNEFTYPGLITIIPVDDFSKNSFSHSAILANSMKKNKQFKVVYNTLKSTNRIKYAGKSLHFRKNNKRKFIYKGQKNIQVILVDDIVTSGLTLLEAKNILEKNNCEVLFALTLSDAKL